MPQTIQVAGLTNAEFFERHETALHSAAQLIEADDSAASQAAPTDVASARALLAKYDALDGREKGRFFDEHEDELKAAAAVLVDPSAA